MNPNTSFIDFLKERNADSDTIQQVARYYIAELTDDLPSEEILQQLYEAVGSKEEVDSTLRLLERDTLSVENACLALLSSVWERPAEADRIRNMIDDAKTKLPVVESALLALVAMYSLYILVTGAGKKKNRDRRTSSRWDSGKDCIYRILLRYWATFSGC